LEHPDNGGIYILAYSINDLVKINRQKQIVLLIIGTTAKKQYKSHFIINCGAINEFINTQFVYTYNLPTIPLIKACAL
jgi:hypothetical protein